jgi:hypothetical protein
VSQCLQLSPQLLESCMDQQLMDVREVFFRLVSRVPVSVLSRTYLSRARQEHGTLVFRQTTAVSVRVSRNLPTDDHSKILSHQYKYPVTGTAQYRYPSTRTGSNLKQAHYGY